MIVRDHYLHHESLIPRPRDEVFAFFAEPGNLELLTPSELRFKILTPPPIEMREGLLIDYRLTLAGMGFRWRTLISLWDPPHRFIDEQLSGPYREWVHTHTFDEVDGGTRITDQVRYRLPFFPLGEIARPLVRLQLRRIFGYRERRIREEFGGAMVDPAARHPLP
jgi:ligand-binding SRPBCC domain-containing protein